MQEGSDQPLEPEPPRDLGHARREPDALTIALGAFFVGLIVVVGALLIAPLLTR